MTDRFMPLTEAEWSPDSSTASTGFDGLNTRANLGSSTASTGFDGFDMGPCLTAVRLWFSRFISVTDPRDLDLLALWTAHTYLAHETYSTPRLQIDSLMPGSGKTTVLEHLARLACNPVQAASVSSPALLARILDKGLRTILIDEVDRSLNPKRQGVEELIAILNSGYKRGATRPVLVPGKGGEWVVKEMSTFAPVALAGNAPSLPDDTRSRCIRVLLMPDLDGSVESSDWEEMEPQALDLGSRLEYAADEARDAARTLRPPLPTGCIGRMKEKWAPLARVAAIAGGDWPIRADELIRRDLLEAEMEREDGLIRDMPAVVLIRDIHSVWPSGQPFMQAADLTYELVKLNPDMWGDGSTYGKPLTVQRMGRMLAQGCKIRSSRLGTGQRGYLVASFLPVWGKLKLDPKNQTDKTGSTDLIGAREREAWTISVSPEKVVKGGTATSQLCPKHGTPMYEGLCGRCEAGL